VTVAILNRAAKYIGIGVGSLVNALGPDVIVLGGGVMEAMSDILLPRIEEAARKVGFQYSMAGVKIVKAELGDDAGIVGASIIARERLKSHADAIVPDSQPVAASPSEGNITMF